MRITRRQLRRIIREAAAIAEKTYLGVPEEHILNALWITWDRVKADVPGIVGAPWNVIGDEVYSSLPAQDPEMAELFYKLTPDEQDELLKRAFN